MAKTPVLSSILQLGPTGYALGCNKDDKTVTMYNNRSGRSITLSLNEWDMFTEFMSKVEKAFKEAKPHTTTIVFLSERTCVVPSMFNGYAMIGVFRVTQGQVCEAIAALPDYSIGTSFSAAKIVDRINEMKAFTSEIMEQ